MPAQLTACLYALLFMLIMGAVTWVLGTLKRNVSIVDSIWSLFFLLAAGVFAWHAEAVTLRALVVLGLVAV